jgi:hypothetical protein
MVIRDIFWCFNRLSARSKNTRSIYADSTIRGYVDLHLYLHSKGIVISISTLKQLKIRGGLPFTQLCENGAVLFNRDEIDKRFKIRPER